MSIIIGLAAKAAAAAVIASKEFIEIAVPATKKAAKISMTFIEGGIDAVKANNQESPIKLSRELDIVHNGLNLPISFSENQFTSFKDGIKSDLNSIKGQNEMLFLSNSISYFIDSHISITGLDRSISYALQYDIEAVRNHLKSNRDIRFPGYLLHQCASLSQTIKELNIFYMSILSNGVVPSYSSGLAREALSRRYGANGREANMRSYIPYDLQLTILRELEEENRKSSSFLERTKNIFGSEIDEINDIAHEALYILSEELISNEELEIKLYQKLTTERDGNPLLVRINESQPV